MGRPTKLTPLLQEKFCDIIAQGNYMSTACQALGIGTSTFAVWSNRASKGTEPYADFMAALKKTEAQVEQDRLSRIVTAGKNGAWQADAWQLERKYPEKWGKQQKIQGHFTVGPMVEQVAVPPQEAVLSLSEGHTGQLGGGDGG